MAKFGDIIGRTDDTSSARASQQEMLKLMQELIANEANMKASAPMPRRPASGNPSAAGNYSKKPSLGMFGSGIPTQATSTSKVLLDCPACGAAVYSDRWIQHEEWHETIVEAIKEQVEDAMASERKDVDDFNNAMKITVLGYCKHGVDLDRDFCLEGCRV